MKINLNTIFDEMSIENVESINGKLEANIDETETKRVMKAVCSQMKKDKVINRHFPLKGFIAAATAACVVLTLSVAGYHDRTPQPTPDNNAELSENIVSSFSVMQVYASDEQIEITDNTLESETPFYRVEVKPCTFQQADKLLDQKTDGNYVSRNYYQFGEYEDARDGSGYMVSIWYENYFDIKGDNIRSLTVSADKGYLVCNFNENPAFDDDYIEMNKSGNVIGGSSIELDSDKLSVAHKIMWKPSHIFDTDSFLNKEFDYDSFSYGELNDTLSFTVTIDDNGTLKTETINIELSFDEKGVMHTNTK